MSRRPVWIDTDTGVDDALALLTALRLDNLDVVGVSAVCGNVSLDKTYRNARNVLFLGGREDIPVYPGAEKPMLLPLQTAENVHGVNGLGGVELPESPAPRETTKAWDAIYRCAKQYDGELELILLGPKTNVALALARYPSLSEYIKRIVFMGGANIGGNSTAVAEFNIYVDPHAAELIFRSGIPIVMCGLDVTEKAYLNHDEIQRIQSFDNPYGRFFRNSTKGTREFLARRGKDIFSPHDVCPILYEAMPNLFEGQIAGVHVETRGKITMGQTITDLYTDKKFEQRNVLVITNVDRQKFANILIALIENA